MLRRPPRLALSCAALSVLSLAVASTGAMAPAQAAEPPALRAVRDAAPANAAGSLASRRRREVDELRRQDLAQQLGDEGIVVRWQDHSLAELGDWRDRIEAARALHDRFATDVDWRALSLANLLDMRLRAAKAEELQDIYRIAVDWRGYTWADLERLRVSLAALHPAPSPTETAPRIIPWDADALAPFDPARVIARVHMNLYDPDAIIEPRFAAEAWSAVSLRTGRAGRLDPDAILAPTFEKVQPHFDRADADELIEPFATPTAP